MEALVDATDSQMVMLTDLVESLAAAESTLASMMAARDGLLAMAGRLAVDIAKQGDHPDGADMTLRVVAAEIGAVQRVSDRTVQRRMSQASWLVDGFPAVWEAQGAGRISAGHAAVIVEAAGHLQGDDERAAYAVAVLPLAETESPNRLRPLARRIAERFRERSIDDRHRDARRLRRTWTTEGEDGMGGFHVHAPAALVHGMMDRLSQMAHRVRQDNARAVKEAKTAGVPFEADTRTIDEIRADLLVDLVLTGAPTGHDTVDGLLAEIRANIEVTVPVLTLMGEDLTPEPDTDTETENADTGADAEDRLWDGDTDDDTSAAYADDVDEADAAPDGPADTGAADAASSVPGDGRPSFPPALLDGVTPIDTATARFLAGRATGWDRVLTHPITGALLAVDRYRPSAHLRRHLRVRDQRCRFPGCRIPARKCDADHNQAASTGGATCDENLCA
ncbi:HNH endonuclease signature motif containing protein, partial [Microbacterium sp. SD291]|uniref:HNH endonuclease n=1 Tax=Microbacterium sp. SD291 TaxID=2782007 RepID=UPI001F624249